MIIKYVNTFFYPISELKMLVENDFETLEKKQLKESLTQTKYSKWAFYIALFALIFTIGYCVFFNSNVQLDKQQYDNLTEKIENIGNVEKESNEAFKNCIEMKLDTLITYTKEIKKKELKVQMPNNVHTK